MPSQDADIAVRGKWSNALEEVFEEHAELRDIVVQISETSDRDLLVELLGQLLDRRRATSKARSVTRACFGRSPVTAAVHFPSSVRSGRRKCPSRRPDRLVVVYW